MPNRDLTKLSDGERLWVFRQFKNYTKVEMATRCRLSVKAYSQVELDRRPLESGYKVMPIKPSVPILLQLARRRHGKGLHSTAKLHGCTHVTLLAREQRGDSELVEGWSQLGYRF